MLNFAVIGVGGYVAPRHLKAIYDTGNRLVAALDPNDSVGIIDRYALDARFFTEPERFDRFLDKRRRMKAGDQVHWISVCSPNYLHDSHIRLALRNGCDVICEKPLVINPWNLDALEEIEAETGNTINTVLQLRYQEKMLELKKQLEANPDQERADIVLTYVTRRGQWYDISWKGSENKSGGVAMNIGIHFFDLCIWLFGDVQESSVYWRDERRISGVLELERARVRWFLSIEKDDLPEGYIEKGTPAFRSMTINGEEIQFSSGFTDLHTIVYQEAIAGNGFRIADARPSVQTVYDIRNSEIATYDDRIHPKLKGIK